jgi:hypothetical protein
MWRRLSLCLVLAVIAATPSATAASGPTLHFVTFVTTYLPLGDVTWTGSQFLYNAENLGKIESSDAAGHNIKEFASFDQGGEEMRCHPEALKYWPDGIYCHTPDNRIVRFNNDGSGMTEIARLPATENSDGAMAFDTTGRFGYAMLAATGGSSSSGGQVFSIRKTGKVTLIGSYPGGGGADSIAIAPPRFGRQSGSVLIAIDEDHVQGRVLAMDRKGNVEAIATGLGNGLNPIVVVEASPAKRAAGAPAAGVYFSDTLTMSVFFAPASGLKSFVGGVLVGSELTAEMWLIRPKAAGGFEALPVKSDLPQHPYNLEGATYVR